MEKVYSYIGVLKRPDGNLEQIVIRSENKGIDITVEMVSEYYNGFSYQEDDWSIIMADLGQFYRYFQHDDKAEDIEYFLVGFWSGGVFDSGIKPNAGRILLKPLGDNVNIYPKKISDNSFDSLLDVFNDSTFVKGIFKYFWPSKENTFEFKEFAVLHEKIDGLANKLTTRIDNLSEETSKLGSELEQLKERLIREKPTQKRFIELKFKLSNGKYEMVFQEIESIIDYGEDLHLFNEYILHRKSLNKLNQDITNGVISFENERIETNRINLALIGLIDKISQLESSHDS